MAGIDMNQCNFTGRLIADCDQSYTPSGVSCTKFKIAVNDGYKDKTTGEWKETVEFINIKAWRKEKISDYLKKGTMVRVTGKFKTDQWEKDGERKYFTYIEASEIQLLGGRGSSQESEQESAQESAPMSQGPDVDIPF